MFFYVKNAKGGHAYADQDTKAWDREKGEVDKRVVDERKAKLEAVAAETAKALDPKAQAVLDKQVELKATLAAEAHELVDDTVDITSPVYRCSWDGLAPYVTTLEGTFPEEGIPIMGWPQTDVPPDPPKEPTPEELDKSSMLDNPGAFDIVSAN